MGIPIYYSASDLSVPMSFVSAEQTAAAVPMTPEQMATSFPMGMAPGFKPMVVGGAVVVSAPAVQAVVIETKSVTTSGSKKKSSKKKVSVGKKKKSKGCC